MEPLVIAGVAVVLICGYRAVTEFIMDVESDGSLEAVREYLSECLAAAVQLRQRLSRVRRRKIEYYANFFRPARERQTGRMLRRHHPVHGQ